MFSKQLFRGQWLLIMYMYIFNIFSLSVFSIYCFFCCFSWPSVMKQKKLSFKVFIIPVIFRCAATPASPTQHLHSSSSPSLRPPSEHPRSIPHGQSTLPRWFWLYPQALRGSVPVSWPAAAIWLCAAAAGLARGGGWGVEPVGVYCLHIPELLCTE